MESQETSRYQHPLDYLKILFRRRYLIIIPTIIGLVFGIVFALLMPPTYQSGALILVEEEKIINPLISGLAVSTSAPQRVLSVKEQLLGWNSLVTLSKKLGLDKDIQSQMQFESMIMNLRSKIGFDMRAKLGEATLIRIAYNDKSPLQALAVAKALSEQLVEESMRIQSKETDIAISFIKEQLDVYKKKVKESEISELDDELKKLLSDSTEQHPIVRELRQKIAIAKKQMETGDFKVEVSKSVQDNPNYQALKQELDKVVSAQTTTATSMAYGITSPNERSDPNKTMYNLILMDKMDTALAKDKDVNQMIYNMLLQKLETAKITQRLEVSKQGTRYNVIDPPRLPLRPSKPNKLMVILIGLALGCASGVGLVFGREFLDQSFIDLEDAKNTLELPVLGGISRITTQEEINKEKATHRFYTVLISVISVAVLITALLISFFKH